MKNNTSAKLDSLLFITIVLSVILFILLPFLSVFSEALFIEGQLDFSGFRKFFLEDSFLLKNSLQVGILTTVFSTIAAVLIAVYAVFFGNRKRIENILLITMISPPFVTSLSYIELFGRRGFITHDLLGLTLNTYGMWGIILMQSIGFISINTLLAINAISKINNEIIYSSRDLGAHSDRIILDIILPMIKNTIVVIAMLTFIRSLADFSTPTIIGGNFSTMATEAYLSMISSGDIHYAAVLNTILFIPSLIAFSFYRKHIYAERNEGKVSGNIIKLERKGFFACITKGISLFFLLWILLNYGAILFSAFTKRYMGTPYFTFQNFIDSSPYITGTFLRSILYSLIAGSLAAIIGLLIGYYLIIRKKKFMYWIDLIATIPYIIPGSFFGIGYILAFKNPPFAFTGTAAIVILNMLFKTLPFSSKLGTEAASEINIDTIRSIKDLGGNHLAVIKDALFAQSKGSLFMSFANGFTASMTTIGSIIFLVYPGQKVATLVMFDVIQTGKYSIGAVIATIIILLTLSINLLARKLIKGRRI